MPADRFRGGNEGIGNSEYNFVRPQYHMAMIANRRASVPLLTAMACCSWQNLRNAFSNSSTTGPPTKCAVCRPWRNAARQARSSSSYVRGNEIEERNCIRLLASSACRVENAEYLAGLPATIAFGGTSLVTTLPAPTIAFSPILTLQESLRWNRSKRPSQWSVELSSRLLSAVPVGVRCPRIGIVDEHHSVANEDVVFNVHTLANETSGWKSCSACPLLAFF